MSLGHGSSIVRDDLMLHLDAANIKSYTGTGTVWNDLSGNDNNGTLVNGVGYSIDNKGAMLFDGINDYVLNPYSPILTTGDSYSQSCWFRTTSATVGDNGSNRLIEGRDSNKTGNPLITLVVNLLANNSIGFLVRGQNGIRRDLIVNNVPINDGIWKFAHAQILPNATTQLYLNGNIIGTQLNVVDQRIDLTETPPAIGAKNLEGNIGSFFSGNISDVKIYNRSLTPIEIRQNFESMRGRYGI